MATQDVNVNNVITNENTQQGGGQQQPEKMIGTLPLSSHFEFEPTSFKAFGHTTRVTNKELCEVIKEKLQKTFHDLRGVMISYFDNQFRTELYFENNRDPLKPGQIKNLISLVDACKTESTFFTGQQAIYHKVNGRLFGLSEETKLLLSDFMYGGRKANNPSDRKKWETHIHPVAISIGNGYTQHPFYNNAAKEYYIMVDGFDIHRILRDIVYGDAMVVETKKDSNGGLVNMTSKAFYEPRYIKPLPLSRGIFVMNIERFDGNAVEEFVAKENPGAYMAPNSMYF